jgi:hypothetical protein
MWRNHDGSTLSRRPAVAWPTTRWRLARPRRSCRLLAVRMKATTLLVDVEIGAGAKVRMTTLSPVEAGCLS